MTCIANDFSYDDIFDRQTQALVKPGDVFWGFSTSGNSIGVVKAAQTARDKGAAVIAFTGKRGSNLENIADICLCTESELTSTAQEIHSLAYHIICEILDRYVTGELE